MQQGRERRRGWNDGETEATRKREREGVAPDRLIRCTAGGDNHRRRLQHTAACLEQEAIPPPDTEDLRVHHEGDSRLLRITDEGVVECGCRVEAEEPSVCALLEADAMAVDDVEHVVRGEARESGPAEMRIARDVVRGCDGPVGEVASSAAGGEDLASDPA